MNINGRKLSGKDIATIAVSLVAVALVIFVVIKMKSAGNKSGDDSPKTTIVVKSTINENGEIEYVTMIEEYTDSGLHASVSYKPKPTEPKEDDEEDDETGEGDEPADTPVYVTDENGERVTDENGEPVTEKKEPATEKPEPETDENGDPVTDPSEPVSEPSSEGESEQNTEADVNDEDYYADTSAAYNVADIINSKRSEKELSSLKFDNALALSARSYSLYRAFPNSKTSDNLPGTVIVYDSNSASGLADAIMAKSNVADGDYHRIGVGVIRYRGKCYTTAVII